MKKITYTSYILFFVVFNSCQFNQSVNIDLPIDAVSKANGLESDNVVIEINDKTDSRNTFIYGEKINFLFNNVTGFIKKKNKSYPGLSIYITENETDTILSNPDLLSDLNQGTDLNPLLLKANLTAALPHRNNENYKAHINIWDKNGDGTYTFEMPFKIQQSDLLNISKSGFNYSSIYLWNETLKEPVLSKTINLEHSILLIFEGLEGLEQKNENVFPIFSIDLEDDKGRKILTNPNLFSDFTSEGVSAKDVKEQIFAQITFTKGRVSNPCKLRVSLKDMYSDQEINIVTELVLD